MVVTGFDVVDFGGDGSTFLAEASGFSEGDASAVGPVGGEAFSAGAAGPGFGGVLFAVGGGGEVGAGGDRADLGGAWSHQLAGVCEAQRVKSQSPYALQLRHLVQVQVGDWQWGLSAIAPQVGQGRMSGGTTSPMVLQQVDPGDDEPEGPTEEEHHSGERVQGHSCSVTSGQLTSGRPASRYWRCTSALAVGARAGEVDAAHPSSKALRMAACSVSDSGASR